MAVALKASVRGGPATSLLGLIVSLGVCFLVAAIGAKASINAAGFYMQLQRPSWAPPAWVFGPVWTILYALMAVSAWLVWRRRSVSAVASALALFVAQLVLNGLWSWIFFQWHRGFLATADITLLWFLLLGTVGAFWRQHRLAGLMLVPYLVWVTFAAVLSYVVWKGNPQLLGG